MAISYRARERERIWTASCVDSDGKPSRQPDCNICHLPVFPGDDWDVSHMPVPAALGGEAAAVAHRACNRTHNNTTVTPMVAKAKRQKRRHIGVTGPGLGRSPMPAGKRSKVSKTFNHGLVPRITQAQKHRAVMAVRNFGRDT